MNCPSCSAPNEPDSAFCEECGAQLERTCEHCGATSKPKARFCRSCGNPFQVAPDAEPAPAPSDYTPRHLAEKILHSKSALEGERKEVTVLFADVKGSMNVSETLDPEVWHGILDRFFQVLADGVHRFEGTINQYTGDGIMALFGAPIAHEDHPQRACYAALQLGDELERQAREVKREHGLNLSTRIGLHTGEVVVGKIGDDLRMDYTAQGHTVGLAARMEELASPGTAYLTDATARRVRGLFELEDLGAFPVRGVSEPVEAYALKGLGELRTRFDVSRARGLTRFVGRDQDMRTLEAALDQATAGNGQVVGVVAEAGTGKSRLCFEFTEQCRAKEVRVLQGQCFAHGKNVPLLPMLQVFRQYYGISERDDARTVREKIAGRMLLLDDGYRSELPLLFDFFGVPDPANPAPAMDPEARQKRLFGVLRSLGQRERSQGPMVILIEDLHWIDGASEVWLEQYVETTAGSAVLLLLNFRPEYRADWTNKPWYHQLPLAPLGPDAIRELLDDLLGDDPSIAGLAETIHARTGGNPFFTEEVVQTLIENGNLQGARGAYRLVTPVERLEIPGTVQSLLAARIDRLAEREKRVLQAAAVIGKDFPEAILDSVAELPAGELAQSLAALRDAEFVFEASLYPSVEYAFKHPLTQSVAYDSLLGPRKRSLHGAVARAIESAHAERLDEHAALLAHHWNEAGEFLLAARWFRRAAEWISERDPVEGVRHWERVREIAARVPDSDEANRARLDACRSILVMGGWRLGIDVDRAEALFGEGESLAQELGDPESRGLLLAAFGARVTVRGEMQRFEHMVREAWELVRESDDLERRIPAVAYLGYACYCNGRLDEARRHCEVAGELGVGDMLAGVTSIGYSIYCWHFQFGGLTRVYLGQLDEARECLARAVPLCREEGQTELLGFALGAHADLALVSGIESEVHGDEVLRGLVECNEIAEALGSPYSGCFARAQLGMIQTLLGRPQEGVEQTEASIAVMHREQTAFEVEPYLLALSAFAHLEAGNVERARSLALEAISKGTEREARHFTALAYVALARVELARRNPGETGQALDAADAWTERSGALGLAPQVLELRARLAALEGRPEAEEEGLREALTAYEGIHARGHAARLRNELG